MQLRRHQRELAEICEEILGGRGLKDIVCAVTPGGGKSLLPQILATRLIPAIADALCWIVPRSVLQDQGARGFQDPSHRTLIGHRLEAMMTTNQEHIGQTRVDPVRTYPVFHSETMAKNLCPNGR